MKANELQINNFLQAPNVQFVIPVYQRNYDWSNTECRELLNDIISVETGAVIKGRCSTNASTEDTAVKTEDKKPTEQPTKKK